MKQLLFFGFSFLIFLGCNKSTKEDQELKELFMLMQGSFNSENQSKKDSTFYNISLHMYPIWKDQGNYLYVEQALNSMQDRPYRQRIYRVSRLNDSIFSSAIFTLPNEISWVGKWKTPDTFNSLKPEDLIERKGCDVLLKRVEKNHFKGATAMYTCSSSLRGASYATSEVEIKNNTIVSWDRGFDAEGNHVWGATQGGYIFEKVVKQ